MFGLYRSRRRILTGVAAGVADRTGIHPALLRLLWVVSIPFTLFTSALLYGLLSAVLPVEPEGRASARPGFEVIGRQAFGAFWALHGLAHYVGFAMAWQLMVTESNPYTTKILSGQLDPGEAGMHAFGLVWLAMVPLFVVAAIAIVRGSRFALPMLGVSTLASLAICLVELPAAVIGLWIDAAALVLLVAIVVTRSLRDRPTAAIAH